MNYLLLAFSDADETVNNVYHLSTESYVAIFVWQLLNAHDEIRVKLLKSTDANDRMSVPITFDGINHEVVDGNVDRKLPMLELDGRHFVVGLCSVLRGICRLMKITASGTLATQLLGHKENCLMSPSEVSLWTSLCEREMISCAELLRSSSGEVQVPLDMVKLEHDLGNPLRIHNVYKIARDKKKDKSIKSGSVVDLEHKYCHGDEVNLSDVILFSLYKLIFASALDMENARNVIPLTVRWFSNLDTDILAEAFETLTSGTMDDKTKFLTFSDDIPKVNENGKYFSLFKRELTGYKYKNRKVFTSQDGIDLALNKLKTLDVEIASECGDPDQDSVNDDFVHELLKVGELPEYRLEKKKSQLKSLVNEVLKIAQPDDVIVDFCSGTGHLGFLVAKLLPTCRVIVLENKEESISRAKVKAIKLQLDNVTFYQCNLVSVVDTNC